jgi:hypothetical protein
MLPAARRYGDPADLIMGIEAEMREKSVASRRPNRLAQFVIEELLSGRSGR